MSTTRRDFLKMSATAVASFGSTFPAFLGRLALAAEPAREGNIFVLLQLTGGNDGLNTVIPFEDDVYQKSRRTLRIAAKDVLRIDDALGFHPELRAFVKLYEEGHLGIIQGVGHENSSRDHDAALRDWHTARPGLYATQTGWVGRLADSMSRSEEAGTPAIFSGDIERPFGLNGERAIVPSIRSLDECVLQVPSVPEEREARCKLLRELAEIRRPSEGAPLLDFLQRSAMSAHAASQKIAQVARTTFPGSLGYPPFQLAATLRTVAQLIRADAGVRVFYVELGGGGIGGFDNHANQGANHGALLRQLSESVAAFVRDLDGHGLLERVLLVTFSEFGRTVAENGRRGTDHGAAQPLFLAGGKLRGRLIGRHPSLTDLDQGGLKPHTDFRRVYATVLERWLGVASDAILGEKYEPMDFLAA